MSKKAIVKSTITALEDFNSSHGRAWDFGTNWSNVNTEFETFINKYLFPKLNETALINVPLGNRFNWLAEEIDFIGQYSEEYVIMDSIPLNLNLSKNAEMMLERNYPKISSKLYNAGIIKKQKFTLNNNDVRLNFRTLADGIKYALAVYQKKISDINVSEESEIKAMLIDYSLNVTNEKRTVTSLDGLTKEVMTSLINLQNNSHKYNETALASGGEIGRYTTFTDINNVAILTTDKVKSHILDTNIANSFNIDGLDLTSKIISFDDLGGVYKTTKEIKITSNPTVEFFRTFGDYQIEIGDIIPKGTIFTIPVEDLTDFKGNVVELKPDNDLYAYIFDINKLRYKTYTRDMLKEPFYNGEFDEVTYWIHYYSSKAISPFYNNIVIVGG